MVDYFAPRKNATLQNLALALKSSKLTIFAVWQNLVRKKIVWQVALNSGDFLSIPSADFI